MTASGPLNDACPPGPPAQVLGQTVVSPCKVPEYCQNLPNGAEPCTCPEGEFARFDVSRDGLVLRGGVGVGDGHLQLVLRVSVHPRMGRHMVCVSMLGAEIVGARSNSATPFAAQRVSMLACQPHLRTGHILIQQPGPFPMLSAPTPALCPLTHLLLPPPRPTPPHPLMLHPQAGHMADHFTQQPGPFPMVDVRHSTYECVDARGSGPMLGTPGGDLAEVMKVAMAIMKLA